MSAWVNGEDSDPNEAEGSTVKANAPHTTLGKGAVTHPMRTNGANVLRWGTVAVLLALASAASSWLLGSATRRPVASQTRKRGFDQ
jgi:hypothetical protein